MDFLQMLYFVTIANSDSMTKAAEKLCLSQSTLSLSYRKLEEELGVTLFRREGRRLVLTPEGEIFCAEAEAILDQVDELRNRMISMGAEHARNIILYTEAMDFSNEAIRIFSAAFPDITFQQIQVSTKETKDLFHSGQIEIAVTASDMTDETVTSTLVLDEPMYVMLPSSAGSETRSAIRMEELAGLPLITQTAGYGISGLIQSFYERAGIQPGKVREVRDQESITIQAINDYGIGFLPESVANSQVPRAMFSAVNTLPIPVADSFCRRQVYLTLSPTRRNSPPVDGFLDFLRGFGRFAAENRRFPALDEVTVAGQYVLRIQ